MWVCGWINIFFYNYNGILREWQVCAPLLVLFSENFKIPIYTTFYMPLCSYSTWLGGPLTPRRSASHEDIVSSTESGTAAPLRRSFL